MCFKQSISCNSSSPEESVFGKFISVESNPIAQLNFTYNVNSTLAEETIVGLSSIVYENGMAILQTTGEGSATLSNTIRSYAQPGQGISCVFAAIYGNSDNGTSQIAGIGNDTDGFFFQLNNYVFGILYRNNSVDTMIPQSDWNVDPMNGSGPSGLILNFTNGNIYQIQYQRLEFSNINFFIESPLTGNPILVHQIEYANANSIPSTTNPGLQLMTQVVSSGANIQLSISSMGLFIEGDVNPRLGIRNNVSANGYVNTTPIEILAIQNNTVFCSQNSQLMVIPDQLTLFNASGDSGTAIFSLYLNPTFDDPLDFTDVGSNSVVSSNSSGTTFSGGTLLETFFLASGSSISVNMHDYDIKLSPGDCLVFACTSATSSYITVYVSVSWLEQF